jgi:hypothetical protein
MDAASLLLQVAGQSPADRIAIAAAWLGIVALAAIILVAATRTPRAWRR